MGKGWCSRHRGVVGLRLEQDDSPEVRRGRGQGHRCVQVGRLGSRSMRCFCLSHARGYDTHFRDEEAGVQRGEVPTVRQWT